MPTDPQRSVQSIRDVARRAEVSVGTVSNVLNRPDRVSADTRERVRAAIQDLGFVRNGAARALRARDRRLVGAIVLDIANPFFTDVARGAEDELAASDRVLMLCSSDGDRDRAAHSIELLREQALLGLLVTPTGDLTPLRAVASRGVPVVLLDRHAGARDFCSVAVDDVRGGRLAGDHLMQRGHRRIGFVNGPSSTQACADRRRGVRAAVRGAGGDPDADLVESVISPMNADNGERAVDRLLELPRPVTAIACMNDLVALGALRALARAGVSVPDEIAVVGYDDLDFASMLAVPLTSVRQPRYEIGRTAAQLVVAESQDGPDHVHRQVRYQPELAVRASSG